MYKYSSELPHVHIIWKKFAQSFALSSVTNFRNFFTISAHIYFLRSHGGVKTPKCIPQYLNYFNYSFLMRSLFNSGFTNNNL